MNSQPADEFDCGCPGAAMRRRNTPPGNANMQTAPLAVQTTNLPQPGVQRSWTNDDGGLAMPTQAHVHNDPNEGAPRPMHLLRVPSFSPPSFDADDPTPPMVTPPPLYDNFIPDGRNPLADYFARLADETAEEDDREERSRIDIPLTPGGRVNRSMDISRSWAPIGGAVASTSSVPASTSVAP